IDPTSGSRVMLLAEEKIALHIVGPQLGEDGFALGLGGIGEGLPAGNWKTKTQDLGKRVIEGVEYQGSRTIQVSEDFPSTIATYERWYSSQLKLTGLASASGPNEKHTARIHILDRGEPDGALFVIPSDYTVRDLELPKLG